MDVPVAGRVREQARSKALCRAAAGRHLVLGIRSWDRSEGSALRLFLSFVAAALMTAATAGLAWKAISHRTDASPAANMQWIAVYTGEYDHGAPVYRFPSVTVIAERNAELGKTGREENALSNRARSNIATRPRA
jgi:hypothetical protein